nr:disease resistance protein RGA2-like [Ziziphus jujuba var. spinosa]
MAEALLTVMLENLNSLIQKEFGLLWGVNKEMERLSSILSTIHDVLEDAEEKQLRNRAIKNWLQKLKDVAGELVDILDECSMEASLLKHKTQRFQKMKDVSERLDDIAKEREKFHLRVVVEDQRHVQVRNKRETGSVVDEQHVYGRHRKDYLTELVYNDPRVIKHFDMKIWVCVSEDFDVWRLIKAMIESASGNACEALDMDPLQKRLQNMLERKKFLLILDDVWNEDKDKWEGLRNVLACGLNDSSIVVTTRTKSQRAFGNESEKRPSLVKSGKEIVKKCKGNPLAAKSLGSLMYSKSEEKHWLLVMESELRNLPQDETSILPALRLSYFQLTAQLRRCFVFCASFSKDFQIEKETLVHLWMANDLISPRGNIEVEEMGNEICNELYLRSFFQDADRDGLGNIKSLKMHDLTLDVSECYNLEKLPKHMSRMRSLRHLYIEGCRLLNHMPPNIGKLSCLGSLSRFIVDRRRGCDIDELESLLNLGGSLRIEHLEKVKSPMEAKKANLVGRMNLERLHLHWYYNLNEVGDQKLNEQVLNALEAPPTLKLLQISNFRHGHLPNWFNANFENLVSICFNGCKNSLELPAAMGKLPSLTSLYLRGMDCLLYVDNESYNGQLSGGLFRLENLQIHNLPNLESGVLHHLTGLKAIKIVRSRKLQHLQSDMLIGLTALKELSIRYCDMLECFPMGIFQDLNSLRRMRIENCNKLKSLSDSFGDLTALETLEVSGSSGLETFPNGLNNLSSLQRLTLSVGSCCFQILPPRHGQNLNVA